LAAIDIADSTCLEAEPDAQAHLMYEEIGWLGVSTLEVY